MAVTDWLRFYNQIAHCHNQRNRCRSFLSKYHRACQLSYIFYTPIVESLNFIMFVQRHNILHLPFRHLTYFLLSLPSSADRFAFS